MTTLERIKVKLGIADNSKDNLLTVYIEDAKHDFMNYCRRENIPTAATYLIEDMVAAKFNKNGSEGLASQSYSGISESYLDGYDTNLINGLNHFRKLRLL